MEKKRITVEIERNSLHRLIAQRQLKLEEFNCLNGEGKQGVKHILLDLLAASLGVRTTPISDKSKAQ